MCFGWYQELLSDTRVDNLAAAEKKLLEMLDHGGMIAHAYREHDPENPELVGRHGRLRSFLATCDSEPLKQAAMLPHEIERFLLDPADLEAWAHARETSRLLDGRWSVVDLWLPPGEDKSCIYGKALLVAPGTSGVSPSVPRAHCIGLQH
jgi:hypothetical protein